MGKRNKKWVIKNEEGLIKGPFSTEKVLKLISLGDFTGTELISEYPGSDWFPISQDPEFYDHLLDVLTQQNPEKEVAVNIISNVKNDLSLKEHDSSNLNNADLKLGIKESKVEPDQKQYRPSVSQTILRPIPEAHPSKNTKKKAKKKQKSSLSSNDIELIDIKKQLRWEKLKSSYKPILFGTVILILGVYFAFFSEEDLDRDERIHLLIPKQQTSSLPSDQIKNIYNKALAAYSMDTFSNYQKAQNQLVSIIEGSSRAVEAMSLLCLTYYELWPFAFQDSMDIKALSHLTQIISGIDKAGVHSATCKTVDLILKGRYSEAQSLSGSTLEALTSSGQPPVVFYYFMAIMADFSGDLKTAIGYLASAQQLWPQWLKPFVYQAQLYVRVENYSQAANIYRSILKVNSQHSGSKIELGLLEYKYFRNLTLGEALLRDGIKQPDKISKKILSRGFFGLAEIFLQKNNQSESLYYAKKAFSIDSTNSLAKNLVVQLGGTKELSRTRFKSYQLI
ncbi:MAG: hypothetical protein K1X29_06885, partial [Bdellovibrionales bacterium]|nr:hypothetical protein [Bdellovibrionales bacterium]